MESTSGDNISFFNIMSDGAGWKDYLEKYHSEELMNFRKDEYGERMYRYPSITIDVITLMKYEREYAKKSLEETGHAPQLVNFMSRDLHYNPEKVIAEIRTVLDDLKTEYHAERAEVHFNNAMWPLDISNIRIDNVGKLYAIRCTVSKMSQTRPVLINAAWECARCKEKVYVPQEIGEALIKPSYCKCNEEKKFVGHIVVKDSRYYDFQLIRLMETVDSCEDGRQPQTVDAELINDLCGDLVPGETVLVYGIPILIGKKDNRGNIKTNQEIHILVVGVNKQDRTEFKITLEDEAEIKRLSELPDIKEKIVNSIAPSIFGQLPFKRSIALVLVSGGKIIFADGTVQRGTSHLIVVGDPGGGKSVVLKAGNRLAVKSTFLSGKGASGAGLTAAAVKDSFDGGKWSIEAGALPRCNGGFVFLDELDKLNDNDRECLHGVLEDGFLIVEKAGLHARLTAETSLIAAANPILGRFDEYKSIVEQINLPPAMLSRFDIILTSRDIVDDYNDTKIAEYIVSAHTGNDTFLEPDIPEEMLKKYLHYARTTVNPVILDKQIERYLIETYVSLRKSGPNLKITARQLGGIIRLAKSSARLRLSPVIDKSDISDAVELYMKSLEEITKGENSTASITSIMGVCDSQAGRIKDIFDYMQTHDNNDGVIQKEMIDALVQKGHNDKSLYRTINDLVKHGGKIQRLPNGRLELAL
jgi:replicative DNA helicase Mcm